MFSRYEQKDPRQKTKSTEKRKFKRSRWSWTSQLILYKYWYYSRILSFQYNWNYSLIVHISIVDTNLLILWMFSLSAEKSGRSSSGSVQGGSPVKDWRGDTDNGDVPLLRISALPVKINSHLHTFLIIQNFCLTLPYVSTVFAYECFGIFSHPKTKHSLNYLKHNLCLEFVESRNKKILFGGSLCHSLG